MFNQHVACKSTSRLLRASLDVLTGFGRVPSLRAYCGLFVAGCSRKTILIFIFARYSFISLIMPKGGFVYIICSQGNTTLYTGVTSDLISRVIQHRESHYPDSFTARYKCKKLVYYFFFDSIVAAIKEEKRIKGGSRQQKIDLIQSINPEWNDLYLEIKDW
jgi:putative endonuclease